MTARIAGAVSQRVDQQPREARPEESALKRAARAEVGANLLAHAPGVAAAASVAAPDRIASAAHSAGQQREVDAFARDRIDEAGRVADE